MIHSSVGTLVDFSLDPVPPYSWAASRWLSAVQRRGSGTLPHHVMRLHPLAEHRTDDALRVGRSVPGSPTSKALGFSRPIPNTIPRDENVVGVFDGARLLAGYPKCMELKRTRVRAPAVNWRTSPS